MKKTDMLSLNAPFYLSGFGKEFCYENGIISGPRSQAEFNSRPGTIIVHYVTHGNANFTLDDSYKVSCNANNYLIVDSNLHLRFQAPDQKTDNVVSFHFDREALQNESEVGTLLGYNSIPWKWGVYSVDSSTFGEMLSQIINQGGQHNSHLSPGQSILLGRELKNHIVNELRLMARIPSAKHETRWELYGKILRGRNFILQNLINNISLDQIATEVGMSKFHFIRCFASVFDTSPHKFLLEERLKEAFRMLQSHLLTLPEIASHFQFSDYAHFSNQFKKYFGFPPSHVQKAKQKVLLQIQSSSKTCEICI